MLRMAAITKGSQKRLRQTSGALKLTARLVGPSSYLVAQPDGMGELRAQPESAEVLLIGLLKSPAKRN